MNAQHRSIDELADAAEGLLDPDRATLVESHLARCPECRGQSEALREVTAALRTDVSPPMPDAVAHRLANATPVSCTRVSVLSTPHPGAAHNHAQRQAGIPFPAGGPDDQEVSRRARLTSRT